MNNKSRMTAAHTNTDHNIREIQFGPRRTNPKLGSKQIWIWHEPKYDSADMLFLGKYVEWFWFWWETASSQLCHKPQCPSCLGLGKFERWWFVRKFPPHHPLLVLGHMFASNITTISLFKYLLSGYQSSICQPAVIYLSEITNISERRTIDGRFPLNMS